MPPQAAFIDYLEDKPEVESVGSFGETVVAEASDSRCNVTTFETAWDSYGYRVGAFDWEKEIVYFTPVEGGAD